MDARSPGGASSAPRRDPGDMVPRYQCLHSYPCRVEVPRDGSDGVRGFELYRATNRTVVMGLAQYSGWHQRLRICLAGSGNDAIMGVSTCL